MTEVVVRLLDELARRAKNAGLLSDSALARLLEEAMRREAGRKLLALAERVRAADIAPMSDEEIVAEVKAARIERVRFKVMWWGIRQQALTSLGPVLIPALVEPVEPQGQHVIGVCG